MGELTKWKPSAYITRRIDEALKVKTPAPPISAVSEVITHQRAALLDQPAAMAMPRVCAMFKKPYVAYYMLEGSRYRHTRCGELTRAAYTEIYRESDFYWLQPHDVGVETCVWCGVSARGALNCLRCNQYICWGTAVDNRQVTCACGNKGDISHAGQLCQEGIAPGNQLRP